MQVLPTYCVFLRTGQVVDGSLNYNIGKAIGHGAGMVHVTGGFVSTNIEVDPSAGDHPRSFLGGYVAFVLKLNEGISYGLASIPTGMSHAIAFPYLLYGPHPIGTGCAALTSVAVLDAAGRPLLLQAVPGATSMLFGLEARPNGAYWLVTCANDGTSRNFRMLVGR